MSTDHPPVREDVVFPSGHERCAAWLYIPAGDGPHPVIVMAHGLGGIKSQRLDAFAERFWAAGYACLVFDYRSFGESSGEPRQVIDVRRQLEDWNAALRFTRDEPRLDPARIVVWGTSFAGGHAIVTTAENPDVAAAIAQCPFTDGLASSLALPPRSSAKVAVRAVADVVGGWLGREPVYVATAGEPGATALMTAADALPGYLALQSEGAEFRNEVAARIGLQLIRYVPGRRAKDIKVPLLVCICDTDTVAPPRRTEKLVSQAPRVEITHYAEGHFAIYVGEAFERNVAEQLAFLGRHLPVS